MEHFFALILEPLKEVYSQFVKFFPNVLAMLIIIFVGIVAARIVRFVLEKLLKAINFDAWSDRMGLTSLMRKGDLWNKPSSAAGGMAFWLIFIVAVMTGLSALQVPAIEHLVARFFLYLPRALSALLILVFGQLFAVFIARAVLIAAVNRGYHYTKLLSEAIRLLLMILILAMALEQLQIAPNIITAAFSVLFGGIVLALAIAFGVGGIKAARRIIEKETDESREEKHDIEHL
jgi:hypothetical protein